MSWIKMRTNLLDDPRVRHMAKALKCHPVSVVGMLHTLWSLADEHSTDGRLSAYDADDINRRVGHSGFASAISDPAVGWLETGENYLQIVRFEDHNGRSAKQRAQGVERQRRFKDRRKEVTRAALPGALPDKRREEKNTDGAAPLADEVGEDGQRITAETVYRAYPKHVEPEPSKAAIRDAVRHLQGRGVPRPWVFLLGKVRAYAEARRALQAQYPGADRFVPACHRWVRRKRYDEDPAEWPKEIPGFAAGRHGHPDRRQQSFDVIDKVCDEMEVRS